jgi:hypothetical protein
MKPAIQSMAGFLFQFHYGIEPLVGQMPIRRWMPWRARFPSA